MEAALADQPMRYPVMSETGGFRKARWARQGMGKSGGVRVIYLFVPSPDAVYLFDVYSKNEKENLTNAEKNSLKKLAASSRKASGRSKSTALGRRLIRAGQEALRHARGEIQLTEHVYTVVPSIDIKTLRESLGLSQAEFARIYAISPRSLQDWEQGRRQPEAAVRAYMTVIRSSPKGVAEALRKAS
jgi:DNA-binding transcriptional regulator YiaG